MDCSGCFGWIKCGLSWYIIYQQTGWRIFMAGYHFYKCALLIIFMFLILIVKSHKVRAFRAYKVTKDAHPLCRMSYIFTSTVHLLVQVFQSHSHIKCVVFIYYFQYLPISRRGLPAHLISWALVLAFLLSVSFHVPTIPPFWRVTTSSLKLLMTGL